MKDFSLNLPVLPAAPPAAEPAAPAWHGGTAAGPLPGALSDVGVDAVIFQDLGVYHVARRLFPEAQGGKLVGEVAKVVGGKGGGRPQIAQAGGKDPAKLPEALQLARTLAGEQLSK